MSRLIVKNLPPNIKQEKLKEIFSHYGNVTDLKLIFNKDGTFRKFAFVGYQQELEAEKAKNILHNTLILNHKVYIETCKDFGVKEKANSKALTNQSKKLICEKSTLSKSNSKKNLDLEFLSSKKNPLIDSDNDDSSDDDSKSKTKHYSVTLINIPPNTQRQQVNEFFYPCVPVDVQFFKNIGEKKLNVAIVKFSNERDQSAALDRNGDYIKYKCIEVKKGSDDFYKMQEQKNKKPSAKKWIDKVVKNHEDCEIESLSESGRLYVRNLPFSCSEEDLETLFEKYGPLSETHLPLDSTTRKSMGFGFITYMFPEHALLAFSELDGSVFQGRMLHILPAKSQINKEFEAKSNAKSSYKKTKEAVDKKLSQTSHNWNSLFMGVNAVADAISEKYGTDKSDILDSSKKHSAAVKMALGETHLVKETRDFLIDNGISLDAFSQPNAKRSKTVILVKNLPVGTITSYELRSLFEKFGQVGRVVLAPAGVTAVVECLDPSEARNAFTNLAYRNFHKAPLYLEWAPIDTFVQSFTSSSKETLNEKSGENKSMQDNEKTVDEEVSAGLTLFVKNLNFDTTDDGLRQHFEKCGPLSLSLVSKKKTHKSNDLLSMGYGFVTYKNSGDGKEALKILQHSMLDGHKLELKLSEHKKPPKVNTRKRQLNKKQTTSKILIRNIPFQANLNEITSLFKAFGELKTVRLPKKLSATLGQTGGHRGFGFVDFVTKEDAKNAFNALCHSTHLYGRRLVLEWAETEETSLQNLRKKTFDHYHGDKKKKKNMDSLEQSLINNDVND